MRQRNLRDNLEEVFKYHPPRTQERVDKHDRVNQAALNLAEVISECVEDDEVFREALYAVQMARMIANQGVTLDELDKP